VGVSAAGVADDGRTRGSRERAWVAMTRERFAVRPVVVRAFVAYLLVVVLGALIAPAAPDGIWLLAYGVVGMSALTALGVGVRIHHPRRRGAWRALFAAVCLSLVGDVMSSLTDSHGLLLTHSTWPLAVGFAGDLVLAAAVVALTWTSGKAALIVVIDAWIAGILAGLCIWAALLVWLPSARRNADVVNLTGYSLITVVALAAAFPLVVSGPKRIGAPWLLVAGVAALMVSGTAGGIALLAGNDQFGTWYGAGTLAAYGLFGSAALVPSMSRIGTTAAGGVRTTPGTGLIEVVVVGSALVIPMTLQLFNLPSADGFSSNAEVTIDRTFTIFEAVLVALVVVRMTLANGDRRRAGSELLRLATAIEQTGDAVRICDARNRVRYANPAFTKLSGWPLQDVLGRDQTVVDGGQHPREYWSGVAEVVDATGVWRGGVTYRRRDGTLVELDATVSAIRDENDNITGYVHTDRDVTRERELESEVARQARERAAVEASLAHIRPDSSVRDIAAAACVELRQLDGVQGAAVIDLSAGAESILAMSGVNSQTYAPAPGGLSELGDYLRTNLAEGPCVLAYSSHPHAHRARELEPGENVPQTIAYAPLASDGRVFGALAISAGNSSAAGALGARLALLGTLTTVLGPLLRAGLDDMHATNDAATAIGSILAQGLFSPVFQPIVELATGATVGFEALTRFADGRSPDVVFEQAHRAGLGIDLERATLQAALDAARDLPAEVYLTLNMSPDFLISGEPAGLLDGVARALVIEVTEHEVIEDYPGLRSHLAALRPGVRLAIDDAGAGYASLRHMLELEPEIVKLDIAITRGIDTDPGRHALVDGMKYFADKRQISLIAEGVETATELATLRKIGVPNAQGYFLARPAPAHAQNVVNSVSTLSDD